MAWTENPRHKKKFEEIRKKNVVKDNTLGDINVKYIPNEGEIDESLDKFDYFVRSALKDSVCTFTYT